MFLYSFFKEMVELFFYDKRGLIKWIIVVNFWGFRLFGARGGVFFFKLKLGSVNFIGVFYVVLFSL